MAIEFGENGRLMTSLIYSIHNISHVWLGRGSNAKTARKRRKSKSVTDRPTDRETDRHDDLKSRVHATKNLLSSMRTPSMLSQGRRCRVAGGQPVTRPEEITSFLCGTTPIYSGKVLMIKTTSTPYFTLVIRQISHSSVHESVRIQDKIPFFSIEKTRVFPSMRTCSTSLAGLNRSGCLIQTTLYLFYKNV